MVRHARVGCLVRRVNGHRRILLRIQPLLGYENTAVYVSISALDNNVRAGRISGLHRVGLSRCIGEHRTHCWHRTCSVVDAVWSKRRNSVSTVTIGCGQFACDASVELQDLLAEIELGRGDAAGKKRTGGASVRQGQFCINILQIG